MSWVTDQKFHFLSEYSFKGVKGILYAFYVDLLGMIQLVSLNKLQYHP